MTNCIVMKETISLVLAHKYNDIYYAINTDEFESSTKKILLVFESENLSRDFFPLKGEFDLHYFIEYESSGLGIISSLFAIFRIFLGNSLTGNVDYLFTSNIRLLVNQYVFRKSSPHSIILVEDGVMNYRKDVYVSRKKIKKIIQLFLGIKEKSIPPKIDKTYLNTPSEALYYFGKCEQLSLNNCSIETSKLVKRLNNKIVFIGGNYYDYNFMSISKYNKIVNEVCERFNVDYYVPHHFSSQREDINSNILNINEYCLTFEMIANDLRNVTFISLGSSVLFTCKQINQSIETALIRNDSLIDGMGEAIDFLSEYCDKVVE